jgi:hypothetical protein
MVNAAFPEAKELGPAVGDSTEAVGFSLAEIEERSG